MPPDATEAIPLDQQNIFVACFSLVNSIAQCIHRVLAPLAFLSYQKLLHEKSGRNETSRVHQPGPSHAHTGPQCVSMDGLSCSIFLSFFFPLFAFVHLFTISLSCTGMRSWPCVRGGVGLALELGLVLRVGVKGSVGVEGGVEVSDWLG